MFHTRGYKFREIRNERLKMTLNDAAFKVNKKMKKLLT